MFVHDLSGNIPSHHRNSYDGSHKQFHWSELHSQTSKLRQSRLCDGKMAQCPLAWLITFLAAFINLFVSKLLDRISKGALAINIVSFVVTVVIILASNTNKLCALFVFQDFQNFTGIGTAMVGNIGIL